VKLTWLSYGTTFGTVHVAFWMNLVGSAYDYPRDASKMLGEWRSKQPVFAYGITASQCEARA
jgi:hypothetical protein